MQTFEEWYKEKYDPNGFLYPSCPLDIGFQTICDRVEEYQATQLKEQTSPH